MRNYLPILLILFTLFTSCLSESKDSLVDDNDTSISNQLDYEIILKKELSFDSLNFYIADIYIPKRGKATTVLIFKKELLKICLQENLITANFYNEKQCATADCYIGKFDAKLFRDKWKSKSTIQEIKLSIEEKGFKSLAP
jgi:hypothetical protein